MEAFWGKLSDGKTVFTIQKKVITIIAGAKERLTCRELLKTLTFFHSPLNIYSHACLLLWTAWKNFKLIQKYIAKLQEVYVNFMYQILTYLVTERVYATVQKSIHLMFFHTTLRFLRMIQGFSSPQFFALHSRHAGILVLNF
jgi:hypothetical protein